MKKIQLPGSKSITNRVLILAALGDSPVDLHNVLDSDDARYMREALEAFGVKFESIGKKTVRVIPPKTLCISLEKGDLFIGNAGTAARFLSALSLVSKGSFTLTGIDRMKQRPQADLQQALQDLGVGIESLEKIGFLPSKFRCEDAKMRSSEVRLSGKVSSQFLTALLLVAPRMKNGLVINIDEEVPSWPYIEMTLELLKIWGVSYEVNDDQSQIKVMSGLKSPSQYQISSDMSGASYPVAWSLLSRTPIEITNFGAKTLQGDEGFLDIAKKMGAEVVRSGGTCQILPPETLKPMGDFDWSAMPDVSMTGMILAATTEGKTCFTGLESLRVKECDRIEAMAQIRHLGVHFEVKGDEVVITGNSNLDPEISSGLQVNSLDDHRIAMCFGVLRATQNLEFNISDPHCVAKTWPGFWVELGDWQDQLRPVSATILHRVGKNCGLDKYLIVKKPRKENAWQFPQGGVDPGETGLQAAKRELMEECGANLNVKFKGERPVGEYKYLFPESFKRHDKNIRGAKVQFFAADHLDGLVEVDGEEIIDHLWVTAEQFKDYFEGDYLGVVKNLV